MKSKLLQMNEVIKEVVDNMDNDTVLLVLGDHGNFVVLIVVKVIY